MSNEETNPPSFSLRLIRKLCKSELVEEIEGNLIEFYAIAKEEEKSFLAIRYWYEVLNYFRPSFLRLFKLKTNSIMFHFNPKVSIRNLMRHRVSTTISLLGFIIGITSVIFLYFYIENELNYDAFHADKDHIYRVYRTSEDQVGEKFDIGVCSAPYARALVEDFSGVIESTVRTSTRDLVVENGDKRFYEDYVMVADTNFFEFFSYPLIYGDPETVLDDIHNVVLSEELAVKYFGDENPVGQNITLNGEGEFIVAGVYDQPKNKTHLEFDMVLSMEMYEPAEWFRDWWNNFAYTYIKIDPANESYLSNQLPDFMERHIGERMRANNNKNGLKIIPLDEVHFHNARYDSIKSGNRASIVVLGSVALAILFIACFNYINLSIAQSNKRAKEVGIRKVLGVEKSRLVLQFMGESVVLLAVAIGIACGLSVLLKETLNAYFGLDVQYRWDDMNIRYFLSAMIAVVVMASGLYPALLLSSFAPLKVLKGDKLSLGKNIFVRKGLIITQFTVSIFLLIVTMLIYIQLQYMTDKDLGYDATSVLVIDTDHEIREGYQTFRERTLQLPEVQEVAVGSGMPGGFHDNYGIHFSEEEESVRVHTVFADPNYLNALDISVIAGRGFDEKHITDADEAMMISESAWKATGLTEDEIIGKQVRIPFKDWNRTIIGIFKDYHFKTLRDQVEPLAIIMGEDMRRIAIKMDNSDITATMKSIEDIYAEVAPSYPMKSWFLQEDLDQQYKPESQQAKVFTVFSGISIGLACMGIFGLAAFAAQQRQKELSIRKVLGASMSQVMVLISKEFFTLVILSVVIAIPLSWYFMQGWLEDFAYRITLIDHWVIFLAGGSITAIFAMLTIGLKTYNAATSNPTEIIRQD
ncbi:MAG: ABC transporter permease [Bacteroidota bacterium]